MHVHVHVHVHVILFMKTFHVTTRRAMESIGKRLGPFPTVNVKHLLKVGNGTGDDGTQTQVHYGCMLKREHAGALSLPVHVQCTHLEPCLCSRLSEICSYPPASALTWGHRGSVPPAGMYSQEQH